MITKEIMIIEGAVLSEEAPIAVVEVQAETQAEVLIVAVEVQAEALVEAPVEVQAVQAEVPAEEVAVADIVSSFVDKL